MTLIALNSKQKPKVIPEGVDERCYSLGFKNQQTKRRVYNTTIGGLVSSVVILGIVYTSIVLNNGM